jgi:hypothetical protein
MTGQLLLVLSEDSDVAAQRLLAGLFIEGKIRGQTGKSVGKTIVH